MFRKVEISVNISCTPQIANPDLEGLLPGEIHAKWAQKAEMLQMHEYYTPNPIKLQGFLAIFTIFVDYADFYVNMIMLTVLTIPSQKSTFLTYKRTSWVASGF